MKKLAGAPGAITCREPGDNSQLSFLGVGYSFPRCLPEHPQIYSIVEHQLIVNINTEQLFTLNWLNLSHPYSNVWQPVMPQTVLCGP